MTIYPKPYSPKTAHVRRPGGNCGGLRLDATSTIVFLVDSTVSGTASFVTQFTYPEGKPLGTYNGGSPFSVTTIPNALPD